MLLMPWSIPSLVLGYYVIHGVLAGLTLSQQGKQVQSLLQSMSTPSRHRGRHSKTPHTPTLPQILERRMEIRRMAPRKKHLKTQRLVRRMGKDFDTFWMSQRRPKDFSKLLTKRNSEPSLRLQSSSLNLHSIARDIVTKNLEEFTFDLNLNPHDSNPNSTSLNTTAFTANRLVPKMADTLQTWLVNMATCPVYYKWQNLGHLYWPRWVRAGSCSLPVVTDPFEEMIRSQISQKSSSTTTTNNNTNSSTTTSSASTTTTTSTTTDFKDSLPSCSWPSGMHCVSGKEKKLRILRWTCRPIQHSRLSGGEFDKFRHSGKKSTTGGPTLKSHTTPQNANKHKRQANHNHDFVYHNNRHHDDEDDDDDGIHHEDDESDDDDFDDHDDEAHSEIDYESLSAILFSKNAQSDKTSEERHPHSINPRGKKGLVSQQRDADVKEFLLSRLVSATPPRPPRRSTGMFENWKGSRRRTRRDSSGRGHNRHHHHHHHRHRHHPVHNGKSHKRGKKRRSGYRCRWVKVTHPVIDDCFCSC